MKKILLGLTAAALTAVPATASAQVYSPPVCNKYVPTCEISETVGGLVDGTVGIACHALWPTLYRLGFTRCP